MDQQNEAGTLLRKARVKAGDYGSWRVAAQHDGTEIWIIAEAPKLRRFRNPRGQVAEALVYRRPDGLVAQAEYLKLTDEFTVYYPNTVGHA